MNIEVSKHLVSLIEASDAPFPPPLVAIDHLDFGGSGDYGCTPTLQVSTPLSDNSATNAGTVGSPKPLLEVLPKYEMLEADATAQLS